jgi:hypothetical protein
MSCKLPQKETTFLLRIKQKKKENRKRKIDKRQMKEREKSKESE